MAAGRRKPIVALFVGAALLSQVTAKTKVQILYETHCPDSQLLIATDLKKVLDMLPEVDFQLVPFGKATVKLPRPGQPTFQCQHGAKECQGNMYHACALKLHEEKSRVLKFVICTMSYGQQVLDKIEHCANSNELDYATLNNCAKSKMGEELLQEMGALTEAAANTITGRSQLAFVPSTLIDGKPRVHEAFDNLRKAICVFAERKPSSC